MSQQLNIRVDGLDKALNKLKELSRVDRKQARRFQSAIKKSAKPMIDAVKAEIDNSEKRGRSTRTITTKKATSKGPAKTKDVTYRSGNLKRSIGFVKPKKRGNLYGLVGARFGSKAGKTFDGYYAAIVNYGARRGKGRAKVTNKRNVDYSFKGFMRGRAQTEKLMQAQVKVILDHTIKQLSRL